MATEKPVKIGPFGGQGKNDDDINQNQLPKALRTIEIWYSSDGPSGGVINGIRFVYLDSKDTPITVPPNPASCWGTMQGEYKPINIDIVGKDYVQEIGGSIGKDPTGKSAITSLKFITAKGKTYGPHGDPDNGTSFTVPLNNAGIYAFFASYDNYLNALGFYAHQPDTDSKKP